MLEMQINISIYLQVNISQPEAAPDRDLQTLQLAMKDEEENLKGDEDKDDIEDEDDNEDQLTSKSDVQK